MKRITINIPDNMYSFFIELVKNLGLEKVKEEPVDYTFEIQGQKKITNELASLRGKLRLSKDQYKDFHQYVNESRKEWNNRNI